jgi:phosphatidylinositol kinase/protein kinase (PI-3  family)
VEKLFPPILGRWYKVTFSSSQSYFSARHQYTKSTAIMSVVGYLFGLGDRHLENIMVDIKTGEIAHVDFNSMFNANEKLP